MNNTGHGHRGVSFAAPANDFFLSFCPFRRKASAPVQAKFHYPSSATCKEMEEVCFRRGSITQGGPESHQMPLAWPRSMLLDGARKRLLHGPKSTVRSLLRWQARLKNLFRRGGGDHNGTMLQASHAATELQRLPCLYRISGLVFIVSSADRMSCPSMKSSSSATPLRASQSEKACEISSSGSSHPVK